MRYKLLEDRPHEQNIEYIDNQITIVMEEYAIALEEFDEEYCKLLLLTPSNEGIGTQVAIGVGISLAIVALRKLISKYLTKFTEFIKNIFRWIGKKLGLLKEKQEKSEAKKKVITKLNIVIEKQGKKKKTTGMLKDVMLRPKDMDMLKGLLGTIIYIDGLKDFKTLDNIYKNYLTDMSKVVNNLSKINKDNYKILEPISNVKSLPKYGNLDFYNRIAKGRFETDLRGGVQMEYGKIDGVNLSILNELYPKHGSATIPSKYPTFYYKTTKLDHSKIDTDKIPNLQNDAVFHKFPKIDPSHNSISVSSMVNITKVLQKKVDEATDEDYLKFLKNVVGTVPSFIMDRVLSHIKFRSDMIDALDIISFCTYDDKFVKDLDNKTTDELIKSIGKVIESDEPFKL